MVVSTMIENKGVQEGMEKNKGGKYEAKNGSEMTEEAGGKLEEKHWRSCKGSGERNRNQIRIRTGKAGSMTFL